MFLCILLPRDFGKSITATRCASLWTHLDDPDMSTLIGAATSKLSEDFLNTISITISGGNKMLSWFCWLYGNWKNPNREWTKTAFHHGYRMNTALNEPSFDITAVDIGMTGYHHDQHWWDDPIIINKLREGGNYLDTVHTAFNASYKAVQGYGLLALVCTRYLDSDVAGMKLKDEGVLSWDGMPCPNEIVFSKVPMGKGMWRVFFWQVKDELTDEPTVPEIMDADRIAREEAANPEDFACQYQNNPGSSIHAPLTESQIRDIFMDYKEFRDNIPIEDSTLHLDTAFKTVKTIRSGDYSVIVPFLHDARPNGMLYLHTDLLKASNALRSEEYSDELVAVMKQLRAQRYPLRCITDEKEPGGKEGIYKQNLIATFRGAGLKVPRIVQVTRQGTNKRARIRKAAALWADGYVRVLLHKDSRGEWKIPTAARDLFNQLMRVDTVAYDDLADASADVFIPEVWRKPITDTFQLDEGMPITTPADAGLKALSRPLTNDEVRELQVDAKEHGDFNNGLGTDMDWLPERDLFRIEY